MVSGILFIVVIFLLVVIWSLKRHRELRLRIQSDAPLAELIPSLAGLSHSAVVEGNSVEVLQNGAFFDVLLRDIQHARRSVHFEAYLWEKGTLSQRVAAALAERARAGIAVRVLVDAAGGNKMGEEAPRALRAAGCQLQIFHPRRWRNIGLQNERDHRKLVVIDGRVAFLGGHCIKDQWLGNADDSHHYRDLSVRLRGPIVHAAQSAFSENWIEETGELFTGDDVFPPLAPQGDVAVHIARIKPTGCAPAVKILHHLVICMARERIYIQNPYFLPTPPVIEALGRAVAKGADVRVMVPAAEVSDMPLVQHAAHHRFEELLAHGVRIFEYQKTLLHQKVMTVDGVWCAIGSSNFDDRSLEINDEITAGFRDAGLARQLEEVFLSDARECVELERQSWSDRSFGHRFRDRASAMLRYQL